MEIESQAAGTRAMSVDRESQRRRTIESEISPLNTPRNEEQSAEIDITNAYDDSRSPRAMISEVSPLDISGKANAKPRTRMSNVEWSRLRDTFRRLYIEENHPLHEVIKIIKCDLGLVVTARQLKHRFKEWGFKKNISSADAVAMVLANHKPAGKVSEMMGPDIQHDRLKRSWKRRNHNKEGNIRRLGLSEVYTPNGDGQVDIIFVHGLNGHPQRTWTSEKNEVFWPAHLLPRVTEDKARILVYGYDADVTSFTDVVSRDKIHDPARIVHHSKHLIAELCENRRIREANERPIIFVSHSLGGLVIKQALIYSSEIRDTKIEYLRSIFVSTYGVLFFGTPHTGSNIVKWALRLASICRAVLPSHLVDTQPQLVNDLMSGNETLKGIDRQFIQIASRFYVCSFHEGKPTNLNGNLQYIVDEESASLNILDVQRASIRQDHSHMCKFESENDSDFALVVGAIQRSIHEASVLVKTRWDSEKTEPLKEPIPRTDKDGGALDGIVESLRSSIFKIRCKSASGYNHRYFIPNHKLHKVMDSDSIRKVLFESGMEVYHIDEAVEIIDKGAWSTFAILICINQPLYIISFIEDAGIQCGLVDDHLPFERTRLEQLLDHTAASEFYNNQWEFTAPSFSRSVFMRKFPHQFILPFLKDEALTAGGFGRVNKVQIEDSYQHFGGEPYHEVVRKEFFAPHEEAGELEVLSKLSVLKHPNIVELLGAYTYQGKSNLIFPLARGGDLADLLDSDRPPAFQADENILLGIWGLCSALDAVHHLSSENEMLTRIGYHCDLKPRNILIYDAKFVLTGFGLSEVKSVGDQYKAPECENFGLAEETHEEQVANQPGDIWSLGCIIMELLVWMKSGAAGVEHFRSDRRSVLGEYDVNTFHLGPNKEAPAVTKYLIDLLDNASTKSERLLVKLIRQTLQLNPEARPQAKELERRMQFIVLDTISTQIDCLYARMYPEGSPRQASIERMRFECWREACQDLYTWRESPSSYHWKSPPFSEFQSTLECLRRLQGTLDTFLLESRDPFPPAYQSPERRFIDALINSLPDELRNESGMHLELKVLHTASQDFVGQMNVKQMRSLATEPRISRPDLWIKPQHLKGRKQVGIHCHSRLFNDEIAGSIGVLFESKRYWWNHLECSIRFELRPGLEAIAELLQQVKNDGANDFRALHCIGCLYDAATLSCGLVYSLPTWTGLDDPNISTLRSILTEQQRPILIGKRYRLAHILAAAVLNFHKVGWLHKGISSLNIIFIYSVGSSWLDSINDPYLLGFSNSQPDTPDTYPTWPYESHDALMDSQHPEYLQNEGRIRYRPEFDYYSLGIILLEIGYWKPFDNITTRKSGSSEDILNDLRGKVVPELGLMMGSTYQNAVDACLSADFAVAGNDEANADGFPSVISSFAENVVEKLKSLIDL